MNAYSLSLELLHKHVSIESLAEVSVEEMSVTKAFTSFVSKFVGDMDEKQEELFGPNVKIDVAAVERLMKTKRFTELTNVNIQIPARINCDQKRFIAVMRSALDEVGDVIGTYVEPMDRLLSALLANPADMSKAIDVRKLRIFDKDSFYNKFRAITQRDNMHTGTMPFGEWVDNAKSFVDGVAEFDAMVQTMRMRTPEKIDAAVKALSATVERLVEANKQDPDKYPMDRKRSKLIADLLLGVARAVEATAFLTMMVVQYQHSLNENIKTLNAA